MLSWSYAVYSPMLLARNPAPVEVRTCTFVSWAPLPLLGVWHLASPGRVRPAWEVLGVLGQLSMGSGRIDRDPGTTGAERQLGWLDGEPRMGQATRVRCWRSGDWAKTVAVLSGIWRNSRQLRDSN